MYEDIKFRIEFQNAYWNSLDDKQKQKYKQQYKELCEKLNYFITNYRVRDKIVYDFNELVYQCGQHNLEEEN